MRVLLWLLVMTTTVMAQQPAMPLSDWRARLDTDLSKLSMPRDSHIAIVNLLQFYEREEQQKQLPKILPPKQENK